MCENPYNTRVFAIFKVASSLSRRAKKKSTAIAVLFFLEALPLHRIGFGVSN